MPFTYGENFAAYVRDYLVTYDLRNSKGELSLGKVNGALLAELANRFKKKVEEAAKDRRKRKRQVKTDGPESQIPPTLEMLKARIEEMGYTFSPEKFMAHYTSNGWMVGKTRMVNWHAACVTFQGDSPRRKTTTPTGGIPEPIGWKDWVRANSADPANAERAWTGLSHSERLYIVTGMRAKKP